MKKKRRRRKMLLVSVASMGDIAFLLIIFFMVCSRFAKDPQVDFTAATTQTVVELDDYPMVVLIDKESQIYFQGDQIGDATQVENEVRRFIDENINENTSDQAREKMKTVTFRCDRSVGKHVFEPVIEAIAKGGGRIAAVGEPSKD